MDSIEGKRVDPRFDQRGRREIPILQRAGYFQVNLRLDLDLARKIDEVVDRINSRRSDVEQLPRSAIINAILKDGVEAIARRFPIEDPEPTG